MEEGNDLPHPVSGYLYDTEFIKKQAPRGNGSFARSPLPVLVHLQAYGG